MAFRRTSAIAVAWIVSLVCVGLWAQERRAREVRPGMEPGRVLTGSDVGVRISSQRGSSGEVLGTLIVRVDGEWIEVTSAPRLRYTAAPRPTGGRSIEPEQPYVGATRPPADDVFASRLFELTIGDETMEVPGAEVTASFFTNLRVRPHLGRFFVDSERASNANVVVISHDLWVRQFGSAPGAVGRKLVVDGRELVVLGVAPRGFANPDGARLWIPR